MDRHSDIASDEDQKELVDNMMERQQYSICNRLSSRSNSVESKRSSRKSGERKNSEKKERLHSPLAQRKRSLIKEEKV